MAFIDDWKNLQTGITRKEVPFFRFFANLLKKHYGDVRYYEVHGYPGQVQFQSGIWPTKSPVQREIGDLFIVTYSYASRQVRYTVMQNKLEKPTGAQRIFPSFKFKADIHQYDLLAFRPDVTSVGSFNLPIDILSGTDYESVGCYGVFYEGSDHLMDFAYSAARWLTPQSYSNTCRLIMNTFRSECLSQGREIICTIGIERFVHHLLSMKIGAPVINASMGGFIRGLVNRAGRDEGSRAPVIDIPQFNQDGPAYLPEGGFRLLLINATQYERKWADQI
jgi:hypothetical protein